MGTIKSILSAIRAAVFGGNEVRSGGVVVKPPTRHTAEDVVPAYQQMALANASGQELEKAGDIEAAIEVYKAQAESGSDTPFTYRRLAILYRKMKSQEMEVWALEMALDNVPRSNSKHWQWFRERLAKIEVREGISPTWSEREALKPPRIEYGIEGRYSANHMPVSRNATRAQRQVFERLISWGSQGWFRTEAERDRHLDRILKKAAAGKGPNWPMEYRKIERLKGR